MCSGESNKQTKEILKTNNQRNIFVASVMGENENYFAVADASEFNPANLGKVVDRFKESASKYFLVDKKYCDVVISYAQSVTVAAAIEANNRADGYFKDMDKKCFDFLMDAVKSVQAEQVKDDLYAMLGSIAAMI